jgi:exo-beta-1,3-glucanase (GH17 family)
MITNPRKKRSAGLRAGFITSFNLLLCSALQLNFANAETGPNPLQQSFPIQNEQCLLEGTPHALSYSGYRDGQRPGGVEPSNEQLLEDLNILANYPEFRLIRIYSAAPISKRIFDLITEHKLPIKVMLGIWLGGEIDNHENCPWQEYGPPAHVLEENVARNNKQLAYGIELANAYPDIVVAVNVGNEVLAPWSGQLLSEKRMLELVLEIKSQINQPSHYCGHIRILDR